VEAAAGITLDELRLAVRNHARDALPQPITPLGPIQFAILEESLA
jgi:hypothetical protein